MNKSIHDISLKKTFFKNYDYSHYCFKCRDYIPVGSLCPSCGRRSFLNVRFIVSLMSILGGLSVILAMYILYLIGLLFAYGDSGISSFMTFIFILFMVTFSGLCIYFHKDVYRMMLCLFAQFRFYKRIQTRNNAVEAILSLYDVTPFYNPLMYLQSNIGNNSKIVITPKNAVREYITLRRLSRVEDSTLCRAARAYALLQLDWKRCGLFESNSLCSDEYNRTIVLYFHRLLKNNSNYITQRVCNYVLSHKYQIESDRNLTGQREILMDFSLFSDSINRMSV